METTKNDDTASEREFQTILQSLEDAIAEFGVESIEVASIFLRIARAIFLKPIKKDPDNGPGFDVLTDGGRTLMSPVILDRYVFGDPSLTEQHLVRIATAFAFAMPTWSKTKPADAVSAVHILRALARRFADLASSAKWEAMAKRLLNICRTRLGRNHSAVALMIGDMGSHYAALRRFDEANACLKEALTISESDPDLRAAHTPRVLSTLAEVAIARGELVMARLLLDEAAEILEQAPSADKFMLLDTLIDSAYLLQTLGDLDGFSHVSQRAEKVAKEVWEYLPGSAVSLTIILIHLNEELGRFDDAQRLLRWLAGEARLLADEQGIDVLDRVRKRLYPGYGGAGLPVSVEGIITRIEGERDRRTFR